MATQGKTLLEKADVINFTVLIFVSLLTVIACVELYVALRSEKPLEVLCDLRNWLMPIISGIFLAYGISRGNGT